MFLDGVGILIAHAFGCGHALEPIACRLGEEITAKKDELKITYNALQDIQANMVVSESPPSERHACKYKIA